MNAFDFPPEFRTMHIATNGATIYVRSGGTGPAVVFLHGYGETGDMWVTCFRAPRVKWPCQGVEGVKFIFHRASLAPLGAAAPRDAFQRQEGPANSRRCTTALNQKQKSALDLVDVAEVPQPDSCGAAKEYSNRITRARCEPA
jgi:hypothetical protein